MMVPYIQENLILQKKKEMEGVYFYGKINQNIKDYGKKINQMEKENIYILMGIIIEGSGKMEKQMVKENSFI